MYRCWNCGCRFETPDYMEVCWEDYYGVGHEFFRKTYGVIPKCPNCDSDEIFETCPEDDDEYEE